MNRKDTKPIYGGSRPFQREDNTKFLYLLQHSVTITIHHHRTKLEARSIVWSHRQPRYDFFIYFIRPDMNLIGWEVVVVDTEAIYSTATFATNCKMVPQFEFSILTSENYIIDGFSVASLCPCGNWI